MIDLNLLFDPILTADAYVIKVKGDDGEIFFATFWCILLPAYFIIKNTFSYIGKYTANGIFKNPEYTIPNGLLLLIPIITMFVSWSNYVEINDKIEKCIISDKFDTDKAEFYCLELYFHELNVNLFYEYIGRNKS